MKMVTKLMELTRVYVYPIQTTFGSGPSSELMVLMRGEIIAKLPVPARTLTATAYRKSVL